MFQLMDRLLLQHYDIATFDDIAHGHMPTYYNTWKGITMYPLFCNSTILIHLFTVAKNGLEVECSGAGPLDTALQR